MARQVTNVQQFTHEPQFRLPKEMVVVRCDDGSVYEFESPLDTPEPFRLTRRFQPDGSWTTSRGILPSAVESAVSSLVEWVK